MAAVTRTDRPKSVRNCCLIELFVALFVLSFCPFDISVGLGAFVIRLGQISSFLSLRLTMCSHTYTCTSGPPRWRRGSGLDFGSEDPGSIPRLPSPRVGPLMARR